MKICYVIPAWSGRRRWNHPEFTRDGAFFLKAQHEHLKRLKHNLAHVLCMVPHNQQEPREFTNYLEFMRGQHYNLARFECVRRSNIGMSYGSFSDAFCLHGQNFDAYLFQEDDVVYNLDNFDQIWLDLMTEAGPRCGFACSWLVGGVEYGGGYQVHAGIGCGLIRSRALAMVHARRGHLPYGAGQSYVGAEQDGQIGLTQEILRHNYFAVDLRGTKYSSGFRTANGGLQWLNDCDGHELLVKPL